LAAGGPAGPRGPRVPERAPGARSDRETDPGRIFADVTALLFSSRLPTDFAGSLTTAYDVPPSATNSAIREMTVGKLGRLMGPG
jgi:hypothetical protein